MRRALLLIVAIASVAAPAWATHGVGHPDWSCCGAIETFPDDFPSLVDNEWAYPLGGWGGIAKGAPLKRTPVIFVHGNSEDASFFDLQNETSVAVNVRQRFRDAGYTDQELWALSYNGQRCGNNTCQTSNEVNVADLEDFIRAVLAYTGAPRFDVVAHSLGVTLVRRTLQRNADLLGRLEDAVFASGANHGTTACRGSETIIGCDEIHPGSPWLATLNGADETPGKARYVTVCDCSGAADHFFVGVDARSPQLDDAQNIEMPGSLHFVTARGPATVPMYIPLIARAAASTPRARETTRVLGETERRALPETGVADDAWGAVLLLAAAGVARALRGSRA